MVEQEKMNFNEFYLHEFYDAIDQNTKLRFSNKQYAAVNSLISNLKSEAEQTSGIEILAREHDTSELSIFLFDIFDRISQYPPTVVYESMPEMVDDFVNTLEVMLEEGTTLQTLEKINSKFQKGDQIETTEIKEDKKEELQSEEDKYNFSEFLQKEFFDSLKRVIKKVSKSVDEENLAQFTQILLQNLQNPQLFSAPDSVIDVIEDLNQIFVQPESGISSTDAYKNIATYAPGICEKIITLEAEYPEIISESVKNNTIIIPETVEEEVEEKEDDRSQDQKSAIENLLSAYFQSEIDEFKNIFKEQFEILKQDKQKIDQLENLEKKFHSFKEISMIHGYEILEAASATIMQVLSKVRTKKMKLSDEFFAVIDEFLHEIEDSERLKGKSTSSVEGEKINSILTRLEMVIDAPQKVEEEPPFEEVEELTPEPIITDFEEDAETEVKESEIETEAEIEEELAEDVTDEEETKESDLVAYTDSDSMFAVFKELWFDIQLPLSKELLEHRNIEASKSLLKKVSSAAHFINHDNVSYLCDEVNARLDSLQDLSENEINNGCAILFIVQENVLANLSPDFEKEMAESELQKFDSIFKKTIPVDDHLTLLSILLEIEKSHQTSFKDSLVRILDSSDATEKSKQVHHFNRLHQNLSLLNLNNLQKFSEFYSDFFNKDFTENIDQKIITELDQSYKLFLDQVEKQGVDANVDDLITTLEEVISELSAEQVDTPKTEEAETGEEIHEEDLDQIFKDETKNYIWKIEDAAALLEADSLLKKPFEEIEKNAHSLKASARLMGFDEITNVSKRIESIAEYYQQSSDPIDANVIDAIKSALNSIVAYIEGDTTQISENEAALIKIEEQIEQQKSESETKEAVVEEDTSEEKEAPLFTDTESDDDLLDIFKEESAAYIKVIDQAIENLKKGEENTEEIHQFEYASHSLKSAAKMLGFREIGQIADGFEQLAEALYQGEIKSNDEVTNALDKGINAVKTISAGKKVSSDEVSDILNLLDLERIASKQSESAKVPLASKRKQAKSEQDQMVDLFLKEAWEMIEKINRDLVKFERNHDKSILGSLNRNVHTLKGSAHMMQFEKIAHIAHIVEDFLENQIEKDDTIPDDYLEPIFNAFDEIQSMMESIKRGDGEISENFNELIQSLEVINIGETPPQPVKKEKIESKPKETIEHIAEVSKTIQTIPESKIKTIQDNAEQQIKISTDRLDKLINMAAELVINKTQLINYVDSLKKLGLDLDNDRRVLKNAEYSLDDIILKRKYEKELDAEAVGEEGVKKFGDLALISNDFKKTINTIDTVSSKFNSLTHGFEQNISRLANLIKMLHDDVLQVRMVPVENLFNKFPRAVRDLAKKQKKKIDLIIEGEHTEMDRAMIEALSDPVMHLIRNSVDHGIELPMHRKNGGKDNTGKIYLRAKQDKNQIIIEVEDDGKGINVEDVRETIISKSILSEDEAKKLSTGEVLDYIFYPGFSTKKSTSKVSGRGIGLDVVAAQVQKLKGDIRVNSTIGQGTIFSIRVPLTLIISQAMLFKLTDQIMAVPLISVEESIQFNKSAIISENGDMFIRHRGSTIPVIDLNSLLNLKDFEMKEELKAILIQETGIRCVLLVDEMLHREEIVIKSLGAHLQNMEFISGGTILGDGTVALIIDTTAIIRKIEKENLYKETKTPESKLKEKTEEDIEQEITFKKKKIKDRKPVALIVDDSISVRRFVASVLEKNNYDVVLVSDGTIALEEMKKTEFDIVITDLEMPKMHGYELIEEIRKQKNAKELPIVILTGRAAKKHKDMGIKVGANAFIVKPFKDNDLLGILKKFIDN